MQVAVCAANLGHKYQSFELLSILIMIAVAHTCGMASDDLLLHPVRIRIVQALLDGSELTTGELTARLGDIPVATLYRHVAKLSAGEF